MTILSGGSGSQWRNLHNKRVCSCYSLSLAGEYGGSGGGLSQYYQVVLRVSGGIYTTRESAHVSGR